MSARIEAKLYQRWFDTSRDELKTYYLGPIDEPIIKRDIRWGLDRNRTALERFAFEAIKTSDEHDKIDPIKRMPDKEYIRLALRYLLLEPTREETDGLLVPKSRQIMITWIVMIYLIWSCLAFPRTAVAIVPKQEAGGVRHIEKRIINTLWAYLPRWLKARYDRAPIKGTLQLDLKDGKDWGSFILAIAKGEDQIRQDTYSIVYGDEVAFQELYSGWYKAAMPTLQSVKGIGGQFIATSTVPKTRNNTFIKQLGKDFDIGVQMARGEI